MLANRLPLLLNLLLLTVMFASPWANATTDVAVGAHPDWVQPLQLPTELDYPAAEVQHGVYYRLLDVQAHASSDRPQAVYQHYAELITNQNGLENNSQLNINYDPVYQSVQLHSLALVRDGEVIDKLNTAQIKILQREDQADNLIYNGDNTINIILDDVRVGDTIDYSFTRTGANPVFQGLFGFSHYLNWSEPVGELNVRVVWEKAVPLHYRVLNSDLDVAVQPGAGATVYRITGRDLKAIHVDRHTPDWFNPWGVVQFSEPANWQQVANWGLGLYDGVWQSDADLDALARTIRSQSSSEEERISRALQFVQNEIRYLGIELGENSHRPTPAYETLARRYGDCKDKTVLLIMLLKKLGIEAHPALVNTELAHTLTEQLPGTNHFDHVITYLRFAGKDWWLDPTRTFQNGLISTIHQPDYGVALVLQPGTRDLTEMHPDNRAYGTDVLDRFTLSTDLQAPVVFTTTSSFRGWNAENKRHQLADTGAAKLQKQYREFYQYYYPHIETHEDLVIRDNTATNNIAITEQYRIPEFWEDNPDEQEYDTTFYPSAISDFLQPPDEPTRLHPRYLSHPQAATHTIEIAFADDGWAFDDERFTEDNAFFRFDYSAEFNAKERLLRLYYGYRSKTDHVPAAQYTDYLQALRKVKDYLSYSIYQGYPTTAAPAAAPAQSAPAQSAAKGWLHYVTPTNVILLFVVGYLLVWLLWRIDQWRHPFAGEANFYPVSLPRFLFMWVFTLGMYPVYWFFRNYRYIREQRDVAMMPIARGLFFPLWYFNLWHYLKRDNDARYDESHLPPKWLAVTIALLFVVTCYLLNNSALWTISLIISAALCLPLANYILFINRDHGDAVRHFSRWRIRDALLVLLSMPILLLNAAQESGFMPNSGVIAGDRIWSRDLRTLQRYDIVEPGDNIEYFYSDGLLSVMEDGNGLTQRHVFSYWQEEDGSISSETATFDEIADISVTKGANLLDNTVVKVQRRDGTDFMLFLSMEDRGDRRFIDALRTRIGKRTAAN